VHGDDACFVELGVADREYTLGEIPIIAVEAKSFADP
jgi:hypothetical protein